MSNNLMDCIKYRSKQPILSSEFESAEEIKEKIYSLIAMVGKYHNIRQEIRAHTAMQQISELGANLQEKPLNKKTLTKILSTLWAFYTEVRGCMQLAIRIGDDWKEHSQFDGVIYAQQLIYPAFIQYSCNNMNPELFHVLFTRLGIKGSDILNAKNIDSTGKSLGQLTSQYYRTESIPKALGFHLALELFITQKFEAFLLGFQKFYTSYNLNDIEDPALSFFYPKDPDGTDPLRELISHDLAVIYLAYQPELLLEIFDGARVFLDNFEQMLIVINKMISTANNVRLVHSNKEIA